MKQITILFLAFFVLSSFTPLQKDTPEGRTQKGKVLLEVGNHKFVGKVFNVDPSTPRSEWNINTGKEQNLEPIFGMSISATSPNLISLTLGLTGNEVNKKNITGEFSLDSQKENPFTIGLIMDGNMKNFTFSKGTVTIERLTPEYVKLMAEGSGFYADINKGEYLDNQKAKLEVEIEFPNVIINGKDIKRVE